MLTVELHDGEHSIGRAPDCQVVIPHPSMSRNHCLLLIHGAEVIVRDCASHNGTFVDGVRVIGQRQIKAGQTLQLGQVEAKVSFQPDATCGYDDDSCESAVGDLRRLERCKATLPLPRACAEHPKRTGCFDETIVQQIEVPSASTAVRRLDQGSQEAGPAKRKIIPWLGWTFLIVIVVIDLVLVVWLWRAG